MCQPSPRRVRWQRGLGQGAQGSRPFSPQRVTARWYRREAPPSSTTRMAALPSPVRRERWVLLCLLSQCASQNADLEGSLVFIDLWLDFNVFFVPITWSDANCRFKHEKSWKTRWIWKVTCDIGSYWHLGCDYAHVSVIHSWCCFFIFFLFSSGFSFFSLSPWVHV